RGYLVQVDGRPAREEASELHAVVGRGRLLAEHRHVELGARHAPRQLLQKALPDHAVTDHDNFPGRAYAALARGRAAAARAKRTTSPITMIAGLARWAAAAGRRSSVASTSACVASVPSGMAQAGVCAGKPAASMPATRTLMRFTPMYTTSVVPLARKAPQSGSDRSRACPVRKVTPRAMSRWVTGIPSAAGTPRPAVTPAMASHAMPARASASASSPPRPQTNGSPPFNPAP